MKEFVLTDGKTCHKIGLNGRKQLTCQTAGTGGTAASVLLTSHACEDFSADMDAQGILHLAAVTAGTLVYLRVERGKTSTTHLMNLPDSFRMQGAIINAVNGMVRLNYCVKSREGCAVIEYMLTDNNWQGKNLLTTERDMRLVYARKSGECYCVASSGHGCRLIEAGTGEIQAETTGEITEVQAPWGVPVFLSGGTAASTAGEIAPAEAVFCPEDGRVLLLKDHRLREYTCENESHFSGEVLAPRDGRAYWLCRPDENKRQVYSSPFPQIKYLPEHTADGSLKEEVYRQQRTLFSLLAEIRALKARVRKLEENQQFLLKNGKE